MRFFKCEECGKIVALVGGCSSCPTMCCGQKMVEIIPNSTDGAVEKHVPVISLEGNVVSVKVGSVEHPMTDVHFIEWIAISTNFGNQRKELKPMDKPEAKFALLPGEKVIAAFAYCNLHSLFKGE